MDPRERQTLLERMCQLLLGELPNAWAIYAYGSLARADERADSDLDLAVLLPPGERITGKLTVLGRLARAARREVDLVDLREASLDLVREVMREGLVLAAPNANETLTWEAERMADYAAFNPRRAPIVDAYMREPLRRRP